MSAAQCIGEPISWLRLERFALAGTDGHVRDHVAACPACKQCLDDIQRDVVALPPLPALPAPRRRWWMLALPIAGALAAAAIALVIVRPRDTARENVARVKGLGEVVVDVVRERGGTIRQDARTFVPGDRWKVVVTCALAKTAWLDVGVVEDGAHGADYPLAPAQIACGNRVVVPGAFRITGDRVNRICVHVGAAAAARPTALAPGDPDVACVTLKPE